MTAQSETILEVVAAKICRGDTFLLCQRAATKSRPLMWEFVGGKVEPGETREPGPPPRMPGRTGRFAHRS